MTVASHRVSTTNNVKRVDDAGDFYRAEPATAAPLAELEADYYVGSHRVDCAAYFFSVALMAELRLENFRLRNQRTRLGSADDRGCPFAVHISAARVALADILASDARRAISGCALANSHRLHRPRAARTSGRVGASLHDRAADQPQHDVADGRVDGRTHLRYGCFHRDGRRGIRIR